MFAAAVRGGVRLARNFPNGYDEATPLPVSRQVDVVIDNLAKMYPYRVSQGEAPGMDMSEPVRCRPRLYGEAVIQISAHYRRGRTVSLDCGGLPQGEVIRVADFCSGLSASSGGWVLRVADFVVLLTPGTGDHRS
ncbi:cell division protein SepF [Micromonospora sp. NPDC047557]|uniref:cell division protein SepF n=2 Tax=unclassified Micromonospora TaxID=2617518 RepID=UPI00371EB29A